MPNITIALIGNPNTGKSSLFNALCGMKARVGNFPGVTVEKKIGAYVFGENTYTIIDLPGTYSLSARSADELISVDVLMGQSPDAPPIDAIACVVDANHLERDLYLFSQMAELDKPTILVLNMWDCVQAGGLGIDIENLSQRLAVTLVTTTASKQVGIEQVRRAIANLKIAPPRQMIDDLFPSIFREEVLRLSNWINGKGHIHRRYIVERLLLDVDGAIEKRWSSKPRLDELSKQLAISRGRMQAADVRVPFIEAKVRHAWVQHTLKGIVGRDTQQQTTFSDRVDQVLAHRWWGLMAFLGLMFLVFQCLFTDLIPLEIDGQRVTLNGLIEQGLGLLTTTVESFLPPGTLRSLLCDGVIAGVGGVLTFVPQIAVLFLLIAILEDCGYMARVAMVMDRWMIKLGLNGKAFLPLITSFGCAVPGIMATRTIENARDRLVTILIAPLMSCSARLPVYTLLIAAFVPANRYLGGWVTLPGLIFLAMYLLGVVVAIPIAWLLKRFCFPSQPSPFVIELPRYSWPSWRVVVHRVWEQVRSFIARAGTLILCTSVLLWAVAYFPVSHQREIELAQAIEAKQVNFDPASMTPEELAIQERELQQLKTEHNQECGRVIEQSFLGRFGKSVAPIFHSVGWDWKIGVGVIASFPAREVVIATLGTIYSLGGEVDENDEGLQQQLKSATWPDGRPVFTLTTAISLMVFFALCAQCAATLMTIRQETQTWTWPIFTFVYMTGLAYFGAWLVFMIGAWASGAT
jgi:ferrous iron transport protein B